MAGDARSPTWRQTSSRSRSTESLAASSKRSSSRCDHADRDESPQEPEPPDVFYTANSPDMPGRLIVIAVDEESIPFGEGRRVMQAAGDFLDTLSPSDRVALMAVPTGRYVDFTSDHEFVRRTVEGMAGLGARVRRDLNIGLFEAFRIAEYNDRDVLSEVIARVCDGSPGCALRVDSESRSIVQEVKYNVRKLASCAGVYPDRVTRGGGAQDGRVDLGWVRRVDSNAGSLREVEELAAASRTTVYVILVDDPMSDVTEAEAQPTARADRLMKTQGAPGHRGVYARRALSRQLPTNPPRCSTGLRRSCRVITCLVWKRVRRTETRTGATSRSR